MPIKGVIFDLFHTLTGRESEWLDLSWTSDVLGIDRRRWDELLTERSRWRLTGEERDPYTIVRTLAREADATIPDARIREATRVRIQRFRESLLRVPAENIEALATMRGRPASRFDQQRRCDGSGRVGGVSAGRHVRGGDLFLRGRLRQT